MQIASHPKWSEADVQNDHRHLQVLVSCAGNTKAANEPSEAGPHRPIVGLPLHPGVMTGMTWGTR